MNKQLMKYIPKEYKELVEDIYEGEKVWNEITNVWNTYLIVEWKNGEVTEFQNKSYARNVLKEFHSPEEYK